jgi:hypothetical protein
MLQNRHVLPSRNVHVNRKSDLLNARVMFFSFAIQLLLSVGFGAEEQRLRARWTFSVLRRKSGEDKVAIFDVRAADKPVLPHRLVGAFCDRATKKMCNQHANE